MPTRVSPRLAAAFVGFHVAVIAVFAAWYLSVLLVCTLLDMSHVWSVSLRVSAFVIAPLGAGLVTWLFARRLLRGELVRWVRATIATAGAPFSIAFVAATVLHAVLRTQELVGPTSPDGLTSIVAVRDAGLGWGADFYCDVRVLDADGRVVAEWKGGSQWPRSGPPQLRNSMRWTSPRTLEFTSRSGAHRLDVP